MASLQASFLFPSSSSSSRSIITHSAIHIPKLPNLKISVPKHPKSTPTSLKLIEEFRLTQSQTPNITNQLHVILEEVSDRVEMHNNVGQQRDNWNTLLLNSINMITLTAAAVSAAAPAACAVGAPLFGIKLSSALLFSAATGLLVMVNKIQPSQLAEEQRNAARLFKQIQTQIQILIMNGASTQIDVDFAMDKILALDKAYPLPLLGVMIEKFPKSFEPASWWPDSCNYENTHFDGNQSGDFNGWSYELEDELREVIEIIKRNDGEDYVRLGNLALKVNKALAITGPVLTGIAALSSVLGGDWSAAAAAAGCLAAGVNALEHGGQIGMVIEMYRNSAGFFGGLEELIKGMLEEKDWEKRENGKVFERRVALKLGRSLSQLRQLAYKSAAAREKGISFHEFASKLF